MARDEISEEHLLRWHSCMHKEFNLMILSGSYKYSIIDDFTASKSLQYAQMMSIVPMT
jgi:hypothetical protein